MKPLAELFRPVSFEEVAGQEHLVGNQGFLSKIISGKKPLSIIFWGPPGSGKTTLAKLYAEKFSTRFITISAVTSGVAELKKIIQDIQSQPLFHKETILFVDEIHRFNKAQQDIFLPFVEKGVLTLVGATTENPSFALNNALLSRVRVLVVNPLDDGSMQKLIERYELQKGPLPLEEEAKKFLISCAHGDGRYLFNLIENIEQAKPQTFLTVKELSHYLQKRAALFDKDGDEHYNLISALHKSVRGSDPDAALYWFCRMLEGGEDPLFLARRLIRMSVEDIGIADPEALKLAIAARDCYQMLGSPEGELALAEVVLYLALAPKSNTVYTAYGKAKDLASKTHHFPPPKVILNAPTKLMKEQAYGKGYQYDHDMPDTFSGQNYFPDGMERPLFYEPRECGFERELKKRLEYFKNLRQKKSS